MLKEEIQWELSVIYASEQNNVSERFNYTLLKKTYTQLIKVKLSATLWEKSLNTAVYFVNWFSTSSLETISFKVLYSTKSWKSDVKNLHIFECDIYIHDLHAKFHEKITLWAWESSLIDYDKELNQYWIWKSRTKNVFIKQNITLNEEKSSETEETVKTERLNQINKYIVISDTSSEIAETVTTEKLNLNTVTPS